MGKNIIILALTGLFYFVSFTLYAQDTSSESVSFGWTRETINYGETSELTVDMPEASGIYTIQIWSDPPFGDSRLFYSTDINLNGSVNTLVIPFASDEKLLEIYILPEELDKKLADLNIENSDEQESMRYQIVVDTFSLLFFTARLYHQEKEVERSLPLKVYVDGF